MVDKKPVFIGDFNDIYYFQKLFWRILEHRLPIGKMAEFT